MSNTNNVTEPIKPTNTENLTEAPKKQIATSIFKQAVASVPVAIAEALLGTYIAYHIGLPSDVAKELSYAIWGTCFVSGAGSTLQASGGLVNRSNFLTQTKARIQEAAAASAPSSDVPFTDASSPSSPSSPRTSQQYIDDHAEIKTFEVAPLQ